MLLRDITLGKKEKMIFTSILAVFLITSLMPFKVKAQTSDSSVLETVISASESRNYLAERFEFPGKKNIVEIKREMYVPSTAYSSTVDQCDSTPCITADGYNVCAAGKENVLAANFLPFGTKVMIPELFGDRVFTVHDRMNSRYTYRVDVWMISRADAIQYGLKTIKIQIVE